MRLKFVRHPMVNDALKKGFAASVNDISQDMNQFCKWLSGDTYRSMRCDQRGEWKYEVSWNTPYSVWAYYRGTPQYTMNPQAHLRWAHHAAMLYEGKWGEEIKQNTERLL